MGAGGLISFNNVDQFTLDNVTDYFSASLSPTEKSILLDYEYT